MTSRSVHGLALSLLLLGGCDHRFSLGQSTAPAGSGIPTPQSSVKVHWDKPEFLYINASWYNSGPLAYSVNPNGTLDPPLTRYALHNDAPPAPDQYETGIAGLTVSPDYHSIYFARIESGEPLNSVGRYSITRKVNLKLRQTFTVGSDTESLSAMAFTGHGRFLYVMYDQYHASRIVPNHCVLASYRIGVGGRVEKLPGPPITVATYTTAAFVANPGIVVAYPVTGPSIHFLYVIRSQDHYLDVYAIKPDGILSVRPTISLALGYRPGRAVFLPEGRTLYIANADNACIMAYRIGPNGMPILLSGTVPGIDPALDPKGHFLYATPRWGRTLFCYVVLPDGTLRLQGATPTKAICTAPCVDAMGRFVYALGQDPVQLDEHVISQFRITGDGTLAPLQPEEVPAVGCTTLVVAQ